MHHICTLLTTDNCNMVDLFRAYCFVYIGIQSPESIFCNSVTLIRTSVTWCLWFLPGPFRYILALHCILAFQALQLITHSSSNQIRSLMADIPTDGQPMPNATLGVSCGSLHHLKSHQLISLWFCASVELFWLPETRSDSFG